MAGLFLRDDRVVLVVGTGVSVTLRVVNSLLLVEINTYTTCKKQKVAPNN